MRNYLRIIWFICSLLLYSNADGQNTGGKTKMKTQNAGKGYRVALQNISLSTEDACCVIKIVNRIDPGIWKTTLQPEIESIPRATDNSWCYEIDTRTFYNFDITHPSGKVRTFLLASNILEEKDLMTPDEYEYLKSLVYKYMAPFRTVPRDSEYEIFQQNNTIYQQDSSVVKYKLTPTEINTLITAYEYAWSDGYKKHLSGASYSMWEEKERIYIFRSMNKIIFFGSSSGRIDYIPDYGRFLQMRDEDRLKVNNIIIKYFGENVCF